MEFGSPCAFTVITRFSTFLTAFLCCNVSEILGVVSRALTSSIPLLNHGTCRVGFRARPTRKSLENSHHLFFHHNFPGKFRLRVIPCASPHNIHTANPSRPVSDHRNIILTPGEPSKLCPSPSNHSPGESHEGMSKLLMPIPTNSITPFSNHPLSSDNSSAIVRSVSGVIPGCTFQQMHLATHRSDFNTLYGNLMLLSLPVSGQLMVSSDSSWFSSWSGKTDGIWLPLRFHCHHSIFHFSHCLPLLQCL